MCIFLFKERVFDRLSSAGFRVKEKYKSRKTPSYETLFGSSPIIVADFVEVEEDLFRIYDSPPKLNSRSIDPELIDNLREYFRTRSQQEVSEIFEEVRKILESREFEGGFQKAAEEEIPINQRTRIKKISKDAFKAFLETASETASYGRKQIKSASKVASSKASSIASERKESVINVSKNLNERWNNLSPGDRKIISELLVAMIEIGLLKGASRSKQAAFAVLSSISRHQTPGRKDLEDFTEGLLKLFKRRH